MVFRKTLLLSVVLAQQALSAPTLQQRQIFDSVTPLNTVILFDSPAFQDPNNANNLIASFRSFVHLNQVNFSGVADILTGFIESLGIEVGDAVNILQDRAKLFAAVGLPGKEVTVKIDGCSAEAELAETELLPNLGMLERNVSIGACRGGTLNAVVDLSIIDRRSFSGVVFPSPPDGFGIISGKLPGSIGYRYSNIHALHVHRYRRHHQNQ